MKKNKWMLLLVAFIAFFVLVYFIGARLNATAEALTIISLCIGILVIYLVVKAIIAIRNCITRTCFSLFLN